MQMVKRKTCFGLLRFFYLLGRPRIFLQRSSLAVGTGRGVYSKRLFSFAYQLLPQQPFLSKLLTLPHVKQPQRTRGLGMI